MQTTALLCQVLENRLVGPGGEPGTQAPEPSGHVPGRVGPDPGGPFLLRLLLTSETGMALKVTRPCCPDLRESRASSRRCQ